MVERRREYSGDADHRGQTPGREGHQFEEAEREDPECHTSVRGIRGGKSLTDLPSNSELTMSSETKAT